MPEQILHNILIGTILTILNINYIFIWKLQNEFRGVRRKELKFFSHIG